jgi:predicted PurR-regulated permease PerM
VPRVISFLVLLGTVLLVGAVFFQVMAQFIVPLFLACVLLVVFQPLHAWMLQRLPRNPRIAALGTTVLILTFVLLPLTLLGWNAYLEFHSLWASPGRQIQAADGIRPEPVKDSPRVVLPGPDQQVINESESTDVETARSDESDQVEPIPDAIDTPEPQEVTDRIQQFATEFRAGFKRVVKFDLPTDVWRRGVDWAAGAATTLLISGVRSVVAVIVGLAIMVISLYYFLADGPAMIRTALDLSPLDSQYEEELLTRFGHVSRAVVVATLLSAVVQGSLAGIGYYWALPTGSPIFLLTAATMITAMVPFVGAAAMWIPVCVWVLLYGPHEVTGPDGVNIIEKGDWVTASILAVYSTVVVSGIDNLIKPFVLQGQSNLHPLLALLSILGGVQVLGPVGILVGPMLVSFLQALLEMLRKELDSFGEPGQDFVEVLADATVPPAGALATEGAIDASPAGRAAKKKLAPRRLGRRKK